MKKVLSIAFLTLIAVAAIAPAAFAGDAPDNHFTADGWIALAAGLGLGLAAIGGALGQGRAAAAALEGIARNPGAADKLFTPFILALALIESLVIYALVMGFILAGNINNTYEHEAAGVVPVKKANIEAGKLEAAAEKEAADAANKAAPTKAAR
jgi:F-type H+-transporting ATPase subunit c